MAPGEECKMNFTDYRWLMSDFACEDRVAYFQKSNKLILVAYPIDPPLNLYDSRSIVGMTKIQIDER